MMPVTLRPIAAAIARVRMVPLAPTRVPATISSTLPSTIAGCGDREPGERVQQRDDDRHVGAADRQHEQHPGGEAEHEQEIAGETTDACAITKPQASQGQR